MSPRSLKTYEYRKACVEAINNDVKDCVTPQGVKSILREYLTNALRQYCRHYGLLYGARRSSRYDVEDLIVKFVIDRRRDQDRRELLHILGGCEFGSCSKLNDRMTGFVRARLLELTYNPSLLPGKGHILQAIGLCEYGPAADMILDDPSIRDRDELARLVRG